MGHTGDRRSRNERVANQTPIAPAADTALAAGFVKPWTDDSLPRNSNELVAAHSSENVHHPENGEWVGR